MILNTGKDNDGNRYSQEAERQQVEPGPALEDEDDSIARKLQELIANEVKSHIKNAFVAMPDIVGEASEQVFRATPINAEGGFRNMV